MKGRRLKTVILAIVLILGCSEKTVKPPSAESLKVKDAIEVLSAINRAYENRDAGAFMRHISREPSSNFNSFEERIKRDFSIYGKISLNLTPRWVRVKEDLLQLSVNWEGKWYESSGKELRYRGNGIFSFKDEGEIKLVRIDGDNPFGIAGEQ